MEKETFKVAKEILEKYDPHQLQSMTSQNLVSQFIVYFTHIYCTNVLVLDQSKSIAVYN